MLWVRVPLTLPYISMKKPIQIKYSRIQRMFRIIYYLEYEGWDFYLGKLPETKKDCISLAKKLSKENKLPYKVIDILAEFN